MNNNVLKNIPLKNMKEEDVKKPVTLLKRDKIYEGTVLTLYKDTVKVGDNECLWDYLDNSSAASIIPVLDNGNILIVRQFRLAQNRWTVEIPAGKLDSKDEDFLICAKRELEEETGYKSDDFTHLITLNSSITFWDACNKIFVAKNLKKGVYHNDRDEETIVEEWSIEELKKEIYAGNIIDGKTVAGILAYCDKYLK